MDVSDVYHALAALRETPTQRLECGGSDVGYVAVPETRLFGATTWLVPIVAIIGPD